MKHVILLLLMILTFTENAGANRPDPRYIEFIGIYDNGNATGIGPIPGVPYTDTYIYPFRIRKKGGFVAVCRAIPFDGENWLPKKYIIIRGKLIGRPKINDKGWPSVRARAIILDSGDRLKGRIYGSRHPYMNLSGDYNGIHFSVFAFPAAGRWK